MLQTTFKLKPPRGIRLNRRHPLSKNLVACWLMNESGGDKIYDLSGNNNTGTITNAVWRQCKFGSGLYFDGTGDYVAIAPCPDILKFNNKENFTIIAWIYPTEDQTNVICGDCLNTISGGWTFLQALGTSLQFYVDGGSGTSTTGKLTLNSWNQVCCVWHAPSRKASFYVNGHFINTPAALSYNILYVAGRPFTIGIDPRDYIGQDYLGNIDNMMIWNRALSTAEIARLYCEPFCMFSRSYDWWPQAIAAALQTLDGEILTGSSLTCFLNAYHTFIGELTSYGWPTGDLSIPTAVWEAFSKAGLSPELTLKVLAWHRILAVLNEGTAGQILYTDGAGKYYWDTK